MILHVFYIWLYMLDSHDLGAAKIAFREISLSPKANSKNLIKNLINLTLFKVVSPKKIVPSAYYNRLTSTFLSPTITPLNKLFSTAFLIRSLSPLTIIVKRKGVKGSPCLRPFSNLNSLVRQPLKRMCNIALWTWDQSYGC